MTKGDLENSSKVAGRIYHTDDYGRNDSLSSGLAVTHEQVSDAYMEGEIGAVIERENGEETPIPRKGFETE